MGFDPDPRHLNAGFLLIRYGGTRYDPTARTADRAVRVERGRFLAVIRSPAKRRRGKPRGRHPHKRLSVAFVRSAPPGRHCDGNGLYLYVQKTGTRSWIQRLVIRGRKRELGLGSAQLVSLAEAREQALANRKLARAGELAVGREAALGGHPHLRRGRQARHRAEARRVAQRGGAEELVSQLRDPRLPEDREGAGLGGDERRRARDPHPHLAHEAADSPDRSSPHPRRAGMGHRHGLENGQPVRPAPAGARLPATCRQAPEGLASPRGGGRRSRRCGRRRRARWTRWRSSSWCSRRRGASRSAGRYGARSTGRSVSGRSPRAG